MNPEMLAQLGLSAPDKLAKFMAAQGINPPTGPATAPPGQSPGMAVQPPANPAAPAQAPMPMPRPPQVPQAEQAPMAGEGGDQKALMAALGAIQGPKEQPVLGAPAAQAPKSMDPAFSQILQQLLQQSMSTKAPRSNLAAVLGG